MSKKFQRNIEDFVCEHCGARVSGDGYTNHCPACLYSKDVDINPGDRASECKGLMRPVSIDVKTDGYVILHQCTKCGKERKNKSAKDDSFDAVLKIATNTGR
ncbi:MAG: RNHCP domain-containing protein [Alphaproteobacteria bacterium]|nr:RNHCP domain-containing protein [Alphaproteobacteria bacterium]